MSKPFTCKLAKVNNSNDYYVHNYIYDFGYDYYFYPGNCNCYYPDYKNYDRYCGYDYCFYHKSNHQNYYCGYNDGVYNHRRKYCSNNTYISLPLIQIKYFIPLVFLACTIATYIKKSSINKVRKKEYFYKLAFIKA